jgi:hypothetical protein
LARTIRSNLLLEVLWGDSPRSGGLSPDLEDLSPAALALNIGTCSFADPFRSRTRFLLGDFIDLPKEIRVEGNVRRAHMTCPWGQCTYVLLCVVAPVPILSITTCFQGVHEIPTTSIDLLNELGNGNVKDIGKFEGHLLANRPNIIFHV